MKKGKGRTWTGWAFKVYNFINTYSTEEEARIHARFAKAKVFQVQITEVKKRG